MANWKFWQRNKTVDNTELPQEVREYYASTQRSRGGAAFLLGLTTLVVTLAFAAVLYFAGRFVWQQFFTDEVETPTTTEQAPSEQPNEENSGSTVGEGEPSEQPNSDSPTTLPSDDSEVEEDGSVDEEATSEQGSRVSQTPNTGPGDVVAIFVGTTLAATLGYELIARKKQTK